MVVKGNYYTVLGVSPEASQEEIKARYIELSLEHHSDKGGDGEEIKKITNAYEILSNYHQRLKYDLGLLKNFYNTSAGEYIESEKWGVTYLPNEKIGDELVWKIAALLQEELKIKNLDEEELSKYGQNKPNIVLEKGSSKEVKKIIAFCIQKLKGKKFLTAIENTRSYLETILNSFDDREDVNLIIEEDIMPSEELSIDPLLTKKELDDYYGHNEYDFYCEKVREEILKKTYKNRRERILKIKENFTKIVEPLKEKIKQRREQKRKLLRELNRWLKNGEQLLADETENKQEKINKFINDFSEEYLDETIKFEGLEEEKETVILEWKGTYKADEKTSYFFTPSMEYERFEIIRGSKKLPTSDKYFLAFSTFFTYWELQKIKLNRQKFTILGELVGIDCKVTEEEVKKIFQTIQPKESGWHYKIEDYDYPHEVISRNIQNDNKTKIEDLITRLNNWTEDETPEDTPEEETKIFVDPSAISEKIKNQFTTYLDNLLFNYFKKTGESKIPPVLNRIRNEIGEEFKNTEKDLKESKNRGEFENARYLIIRTICEEVSNTGGSDEELKERVKKINWSFLQEIYKELEAEGIKKDELPDDDKFKFKKGEDIKTNYAKKIIEWELEILKKYANNYITWQKTTITEVKDYWNNTLAGLIRKSAEIKEAIGENWEAGFNTKTTEDEIKVEKERLIGLIDIFKNSEINAQNLAISGYDDLLNSINKEVDPNNDYTLLINGLDWVRLTGSRTKDTLINAWNNRKNYLKDEAKKEQKRNAETAYDNLLNQIQTESNQNADYTQRINNLDWTNLSNPQTKTALNEAWTKRKNQLAEMARKEQEQRDKQAQQQAEKERKEKEEKEKKAKEELENGNEEEKQQYQELKRKIENGEDVDPLKIENLRLDKWKNELQELLKNKLEEREQTYPKEQKLNKDLENLRNPTFLSSILKLVSLDRWEFLHKKKNTIDKWFSELEEFLRKNDFQFLKKVCEEIPENKREEAFSEIFSELNKEKNEIKNSKDFKRSNYSINEVEKYIKEITNTIKERLMKIAEEDEAKDDINSIMEEAEKIEREFISNVKVSQKKIEEILEKLSNSFKSNAKNKKNLVNQKKIMGIVASFVEKIEEVSKAIRIVREIVTKNYLKSNEVNEEKVKKWLSELEKKNFKNSREVAQHFQNMVNEINQGASANTRIQNGDKNIITILTIAGLISVLAIGGLVILKKRLNKKLKK